MGRLARLLRRRKPRLVIEFGLGDDGSQVSTEWDDADTEDIDQWLDANPRIATLAGEAIDWDSVGPADDDEDGLLVPIVDVWTEIELRHRDHAQLLGVGWIPDPRHAVALGAILASLMHPEPPEPIDLSGVRVTREIADKVLRDSDTLIRQRVNGIASQN